MDVAKEQINNQIIYFPEFENYEIFEGKVNPEAKKKGGLIEAFRFVGSGLGSLATYFASKYQEYDMNNKIINGTTSLFKAMASTGKIVYKYSKPVVKYTSIRVVQGIGYLCKQAEINLFGNKNNEDEEEEEEEKDKNNNKNDKKNKKKKKKKKDNKKNEMKYNTNGDNNNINNLDNNQNNLCLPEGQFIFEPCVDYPTFEIINIMQNSDNNQNNDFYQNNNIPPSIQPIQYNNSNNQINKPEYVIPPSLDSSSHENSIVGEK